MRPAPTRGAKGGATTEAQRHKFELMGGWPGALIAQQAFRHKTRKVSLQVVFWAIVEGLTHVEWEHDPFLAALHASVAGLRSAHRRL